MVSTTIEIPRAHATGERPLYTWGAIVAITVVFAGFAPTYYLKSVYGTPGLDTLRHVHGLVMSAWFALFLVQARLVAGGNVRLHRRLGVAGLVLATVVLALGTMSGIASARSGTSPIGVPPLVFLVMPLGEMVAFAALFGAAIALRKRPPWHKRLMLVATLAMLTPAIARLPFAFVKAGGPPVFFALTDLVLLGCIAFDVAKNRRVHPAFVAGFAVVVFVQVGRLLLARTEAWMTFARWVVA